LYVRDASLNLPFDGNTCRSSLPQKLPFMFSNLYYRVRPEITVPGIAGNVLLAAVLAIRAMSFSAYTEPHRKKKTRSNMDRVYRAWVFKRAQLVY
jgi:hypothetical protein